MQMPAALFRDISLGSMGHRNFELLARNPATRRATDFTRGYEKNSAGYIQDITRIAACFFLAKRRMIGESARRERVLARDYYLWRRQRGCATRVFL